ncbi:MAG TPA: amidase family protein, partial [Pirellulales bacterium]|nr:amidase family protein [Pirellulales bacterium]
MTTLPETANAGRSPRISIDASGAFVSTFSLSATGDGPLAGLRFGVKDLIDVAGHVTACGNPTWRDTHPPATVHAVAVEQLLSAGAAAIGKTVTDELAFSLVGENHFYGTPLNPAAPGRVPGGSSSGSASAVACGLVDFALGTDTGGSVRVPASNCGIWGLRPSHGRISVAGVMPFAPSFDTVGVLAASAAILERVGAVLVSGAPLVGARPTAIHLIDEAFDLVDSEIRAALAAPIDRLRSRYGAAVRRTSLSALCGADFTTLYETFCTLQWAEITSSLGAWIAAARPEFGPVTANTFELAGALDRGRVRGAALEREAIFGRLGESLGRSELLCLPTVTASAPLKREIAGRQADAYYRRALSLTALAGIGR